jgi:predicted PurR-regulated permease PerM
MLAFIAYVAPLAVLGPQGIIVGPLVYGFLIASHRTASHFREMKSSSDSRLKMLGQIDIIILQKDYSIG